MYGVSPIVTLAYYDSDGVEIFDPEVDGVISYVYTVEVPTALEGPSVENIMVVPLTSYSDFSFVYSTDIQLSSPPLSGKYYINCGDTDGNIYSTLDLDVSNVEAVVKTRLENDCPWLKGGIDVTRVTSTWSDKKMGIEFQVHFHGISGELP